MNISRGWTGSKTSLNVKGQDFHTPDHANPQQQIEQRLEQTTQQVVDRVIQVKCSESLMSKQSLDGGMKPKSIYNNY